MKPFTNLRMNMCIDTFAIIHINIYIYTRLCHVDVKINTIVYHSMYMCLYILYVCRPLNLSKHTKFQQYRIPVISIASTRFFNHVIFYSTMFFPHRLMTWCLYITTSFVARNVFEWLKVLFICRATYHPWHTTGGEDWTPLVRCAVLSRR